MTRLQIGSMAVLAAAGLASVGVLSVKQRGLDGSAAQTLPSPAREPKHAEGPAVPEADELRGEPPRRGALRSAAQALPSPAGEPKHAARPDVPEAGELRSETPRRGALRIARLRHAGDWNLAPQAIPNLTDILRQPPFRFDVVLGEKTIFARDPSLIYYPLIYVRCGGAISFPKEDLDALRRHLDPGGGTLFADAAYGSPVSDAAFRRFVAELLPGRKLVPIPMDDELYSEQMGFDLSQCRLTNAADEGKGFPQLEGVKIDGHWAVIYSKFDVGYALDPSPGTDRNLTTIGIVTGAAAISGLDWNGGATPNPYAHESAVRIYGNIIIYSTFP